MIEKEVMTATGIHNNIVISIFKRMKYQIYQRTALLEKIILLALYVDKVMHIYSKCTMTSLFCHGIIHIIQHIDRHLYAMHTNVINITRTITKIECII